jgi:alanine racemase
LDDARAPALNGGVQISPHVICAVNLSRVRANAEAIRQQVREPILAVVKADGYGLGARRIIEAIDDLCDQWCVFALHEIVEGRLHEVTRKPFLVLGPMVNESVDDYRLFGARPSTSSVSQARVMRAARPVLCVDTGMQRFACPPADVPTALEAGHCTEAFTHAINLQQVKQLVELAGNGAIKLHAASTSLLHEPAAWLDGVRPGLALYRGAAGVSARLVEVHDSTGPAGYSGFVVPRHGVILVGYSHGLRPGPCLVNGRLSRVLEVGMQSAFVEIGPKDFLGDEVVLLGDTLDEATIAEQWKTTPQLALLSLCGAGTIVYST